MRTIVKTLADLGYGVGWRVLDAQWFGLAQRRKRVFIVGCLGNVRRAAEILFERESLPWDSPPSREAGKETAGGVAGCLEQNQRDEVRDLGDLATSVKAQPGMNNQCYVYALQERMESLNPDAGPHGKGWRDDGAAFTMEARSKPQAIAFQTRIARNGRGQPKDTVDALVSSESGVHGDSKPHVAYAGGVRRLTPKECARLQGFPDDWLDGLSDSAKYRCLGNAVAVPVAEWIGRRIMEAK